MSVYHHPLDPDILAAAEEIQRLRNQGELEGEALEIELHQGKDGIIRVVQLPSKPEKPKRYELHSVTGT